MYPSHSQHPPLLSITPYQQTYYSFFYYASLYLIVINHTPLIYSHKSHVNNSTPTHFISIIAAITSHNSTPISTSILSPQIHATPLSNST